MEDYIVQCEKAMQTGKREDLPKYLQTKLNDLKRERENAALKKTASPPKTTETVPTQNIKEARAYTSTTTIAKTSVQVGKGKTSPSKEKKREKEEKQCHEPQDIVAIESDVESDAELLNDE